MHATRGTIPAVDDEKIDVLALDVRLIQDALDNVEDHDFRFRPRGFHRSIRRSVRILEALDNSWRPRRRLPGAGPVREKK